MPPKSKTQKPRATQEKRVKASAVKKTASEQHSSAEKAGKPSSALSFVSMVPILISTGRNQTLSSL